MRDVRKFVIQKHSKASEAHWDLMLEVSGVLQTYRLELPPEKLPQQLNTAVKISDHPLKFLTYEGSVDTGSGNVEIADSGTYRLLNGCKDRQELQLDGKILKGKFTLTHIKDDKWEFTSEF